MVQLGKLYHTKTITGTITHLIFSKNKTVTLSSYFGTLDAKLRKRLRIRSVISVNYHYITVLCPFNLLIRFKCYNTV